MLDPVKLNDFIKKQWEKEIIPALQEYIKIPNKSPLFDQQWQQNGYMDQALKLIIDWCHAHAPNNMSLEVLRIEGRTPLLLINIPGEIKSDVLLYGHFDKQPEMEGWREDLGPWKPHLENGRLYGRGGADDGYAVFSAITAIKSLQEQNIPHPNCIVIIEASEESGSMDLLPYITNHKEKLGNPQLVICLDSGAGNYEQLWITNSLRGDIVGELTVELLKEGIHSGYGSGLVADSFRVARQLLSRIEDEETGKIKLEELFCEIPPSRVNEAADCAQVLCNEIISALPLHPGVKTLDSNNQQLLLNKTWRPTLTITGCEGIPLSSNAGNVLRPKTTLKFSIRIPPVVDSQLAAAAVVKALSENSPYHAKVTVNILNTAKGWDAPEMSPWLGEALNEASLVFYQKPVVYTGEGGTIPFMEMLGRHFPQAQFMITGVLGPHSNAHGPNEFLHLEMAEKVTACVAYILFKYSQSYSIRS
jgi:acetylornithine deacetylase/succinyl-diaminopimelate desuccinylase-like protein